MTPLARRGAGAPPQFHLPSHLLLAAILVGALLLRVYDLQPYAWVPDQYDRLADAKLIASGHLPQSRIYPPGGALVFALPVGFVSNSLLTLQAVTVGFGVALVCLAYFATWHATRDRLAAVLAAGGCAVLPMFVYLARSGALDIAIVFLIALSVFLLPALRGRPLGWFAACGALLALLVSIRLTNAVLVVPLVIYWLALSETGFDPRRMIGAVTARGVLVAAATFVGLMLPSLFVGRWYATGSDGVVTFDSVLANLSVFAKYALVWPLTPLVVPAAAFGFRRLWQMDRPLSLAIAALTILWPLSYAPFYFTSWRYAAPVTFFVLFLASVGWASLLATAGQPEGRIRKGARLLAGGSLACFALFLVTSSMMVTARWPTYAAESDAGLAREVAPVLDGLDETSLVVSAVARAFAAEETPVAFLDVMELSLATNDSDATTTTVVGAIQEALAGGRDVYFLFSNFEADRKKFGRPSDNFRFYFEEVQKSFALTEVFRTKLAHDGRLPWVLYRIEQGPPPDDLAGLSREQD